MAKKTRTENTFLNTVAGLSAKMVNIVTGLVMRTLFIRLLGIEYSGISTLFSDILSTLSLAELGIGSAIVYALFKPVASGDHKKTAALMHYYKRAYQLVAAVVLIAGLAVVPFLDFIVKDVPNVKEDIRLIYILYVINSAVSYLLIYRSTLLTAHQERRKATVIQIVVSLARVALEAVILLVFKNFLAYLIAGIIITRLQNYLISQMAKKRYPEIDKYPDERLTKQERDELGKNIRAMMLYKISRAIAGGCDSIIITSFFGASWVGMVGNYTIVINRVTAFINQLYNSASPSVGNLVTEDNTDKQHKTFRTMQFLAFWLACFCSVSFIVLFNPFIRIWFGKKYLMPMMLPIALTLYFFLNCLLHPVLTFRNTNGLFVQGKYRPIIMVVLNIALSVLGAYYWQKRGDVVTAIVFVKLATSVAQLATAQWFDPWLVYKNVFKKPFIEYLKNFALYIGFTAACVALTYWVGTLLPYINKYWTFFLRIPLCLIIPNAAVILCFGRTQEFKDLIAALKVMLEKWTKGLSAKKNSKTDC